jgi:hypothetical protein
MIATLSSNRIVGSAGNIFSHPERSTEFGALEEFRIQCAPPDKEELSALAETGFSTTGMPFALGVPESGS